MSAAAYSGGGDAGGKFRKRPFRQAPATPYDRPASAARGAALAAAGGDSLRSRIVGTASRLIAGGATWFLGSLFRKRLTAPPVAAAQPPVAAEENFQVGQEVSEVACINTLPELREKGHVREASSFRSSSDTDGISELEKLLKQKTFTRVEFNHLTELLRSRTTEPGTVETTTNTEKKENEDNPAQDSGVEAPISRENFSTLATITTVARDELASPAELAKAYMGSIPSKVSPSSLSLRGQMFREDITVPSSSLSLRGQMFREDTTVPSLVPFVSKPVKRSPLPRSVAQYSEIPEFPEITYETPKPRGRLEISPPSTSPYFKARPTTNTKGGDLTGDVYSGPSSSRLTQKNFAHSGGRQVLKRRSSVLDNDFDSFGPIRRIRQKYHLTPRSRNPPSVLSNNDISRGSTLENSSQEELKHYNISLHESEIKENKTFPPSVTPIPSKSSETAMKILQHLDILTSPPKELNQINTSLREAENKLSPTSATPVPPKSSETGMKILQHLDILVSPSKEKSSDPKTVVKDKSQSTSTGSVIGGKALKSTGESDPPTNSNRQGSSSTLINSPSNKKYGLEVNGPSQALFSGDKLMSEYSTVNTAVPPTDANPGTSNVNLAISGFAVQPLRQSSAYRMSIPEDPLVPDHENHILGDVSGSLSTKSNDLKGKILKQNISTSDTTTSEKSPMAFSSRRKGSGGLVLPGKDSDFSFSVSSSLSTPFQLPPTPTMPGSSLDTSALQKEQTVTPTFGFGLKAAPISLVPSSMGSIGNATSQEVNASNASMATAEEGSSSGKIGAIPKDATSFKSFGSAVSSGIITTNSSGVFGFGSSSRSTTTTSTQSNGSLFPASLVSPLSAGPAVTSSDNRANSTFFTTTANTNGTSSITSMSSPFTSTSAPISTVASFKFGASTKTGNSTAAPEPTSASPSTGSIFKFGASAQPTTSSSSQLGSMSPFVFGTPAPAIETKTSSGLPIFGGSVSSNPSTVVPAATTNVFNSSSQPFTSSAFGFTTGSSASSSSTGFAFGNSSSTLGSSSSPFGSAVFSFTSAITTTSRASPPAVPVFGLPTSAVGFGSESPGSQMNVEQTTTNAANQAAVPTASVFGQPTNSSTTPPFVFGSGAVSSGGPSLSQFAGQQFPSTQGQPFQAGNLAFSPGGGFSQESGVGDKSARRIIRIKRDSRKSRK